MASPSPSISDRIPWQREIALAFGVPPLLLGLPGDNTFANYSEANRAFWRQTVLPLITRVQKSFQAWLQPGYGAFRLDYNADRLEALATERASEWDRIGKASFLTLDEQREAVGYGPAPKDGVFAKWGGGFERRYSPNQPRAPAGSAEGGQWTSGGGGGGGVAGSVSLLSDVEQVALNIDPNVVSDAGLGGLIQSVGDFIVNLLDEEGGVHKGHAIQDHVGRTDEWLRDRIRNSYDDRLGFLIQRDTRAGTFPSVEAANKLVNSILSRNPQIVTEVAAGRIGRAALRAMFGSPTGREAYTVDSWKRNAPIFFRVTYGAAVVIIHDKRKQKGYSVLTAFPIFD